jgi:hypothetical protein
MNPNNCKSVRRELDELNLDKQLSSDGLQHLKACAECRRFDEEQRALRGLIASLETVSAPADFDFRLRARLAREKGVRSSYLNRTGLWATLRPIAAAGMVLLITVAGILVKNRLSANNKLAATPVKSSNPVAANPAPSPQEVVRNREAAGKIPKTDGAVSSYKQTNERRAGGLRRRTEPGTSSALAENKRRSATRDSSQSLAPLVTRSESLNGGPLLFVPIDTQPLRLWIDNGRGGERTISLPAVSFGSQRLLARGTSFAPVSSARGVW